MYDSSVKNHAIRLRLSGKSYNEIKNELNLRSKSTLSVWFKDLELTPEAEILLKESIDRATRCKLLEFNKRRSERILKENEDSRKAGYAEIKSLSNRDLLVAGTALYWGEGTKSEGSSSYNSVSFSNSDPTMIKLFLRFLREILNVPEAKILCALHIYESIDRKMAIDFWSECTGVPTSQFTTSYQVSRAGKGIRKTLPFGTLHVRVHNRHMFYRIKGLIDGLGK